MAKNIVVGKNVHLESLLNTLLTDEMHEIFREFRKSKKKG